jgi:hypothetical protein
MPAFQVFFEIHTVSTQAQCRCHAEAFVCVLPCSAMGGGGAGSAKYGKRLSNSKEDFQLSLATKCFVLRVV